MTQNWIERIDDITKLFMDHFGSLNHSELNKKSNPETWSIAQNIEHLILINETYFKIFEELKSGTLQLPFYGNIGFISSFFGDLILKAVEPDRKKKNNTFVIWKPSESQVSSKILENFVTSQKKLKNHINILASKIKANATIHTPVSKSIPLPLKSAIEIIVTHEMRHFNQASEVLEHLHTS